MANGPSVGLMMVDQQTLRAIAAAIGASNLAGAAGIAERALRAGVQHPTLYNARALWAQQQGRHQTALDDFNRALSLSPNNPAVLSAIGLCLVRLNRPAEAVAAFDAAIAAEPGFAEHHYLKGWAHDTMADQAKAKPAYERAVALQPNYPEALAALAVIAARGGDAPAARDLAARALRGDGSEPTAVIALAIADNAERDFGAAERRLRAALASPRAVGQTRAVMLGFLADALDGQDKIAEAFDAYAAENEEHRKLYEAAGGGQSRSADLLAQLTEAVAQSPAQAAATPAAPSANDPRQHVFLLGFLRSGTTLLEQVLATHPDIAALEERETFAGIAPAFLTDAAGLARLAALDGAALEEARQSYWQSVRSHGAEPAGKVFIDKQPLNTFNLPLIAKLFPQARIIFALRDPRDVVFSCFRRHFGVNATTYELLRLDDAARYYAAVMQLAELSDAKYPLARHTHRYEDMVRDFDGAVRAVCDFIGLEWSDSMRDFAAAARERTIRSPSAAQVRRKLYDDGVGQWRRYGAQLKPIQPILQPWVAKFGYEPD
ncbi:MAG TPA: sulfotransferase [Rhizomicrobium sp.]|jgi:Tfp pilus assembly protein PilF|nr:sulfotransferase [Rhizomicrobium sp.]